MNYFVAFTLPILFLAQSGREPIELLIKKLASSNFHERQAATKALQVRPEAAPALRDALKSADTELRTRAAEILDYFDRLPVRELDSAVKDGNILLFVNLQTSSPSGKYQAESWFAASDLARKLIDLHETKGGKKIQLRILEKQIPQILNEKRVTESTKAQFERYHFVRASEVDLDRRRRKAGEPLHNLLEDNAFFVASRSVRILTNKSQIIFAGGSVEITDGGAGIQDSIIVCGGDLTLDCALARSLIIARGKIISNGFLGESRLISGKSLSTSRPPQSCLISENDANPLGFIRWADAPKVPAK